MEIQKPQVALCEEIVKGELMHCHGDLLSGGDLDVWALEARGPFEGFLTDFSFSFPFLLLLSFLLSLFFFLLSSSFVSIV